MLKNIGSIIVLISVVCYAIVPVLLKKTSDRVPPFTLIAISMFLLFIGSLILSFIFEAHGKMSFYKFSSQDYVVLAVVGVINLLGFWLGVVGYKYMQLWQQTLFNLLGAVFTGVFAFFILKEALTWKFFFGVVVMGVGLLLAAF